MRTGIKKKFDIRGKIAKTREMGKEDCTLTGKSRTVKNHMVNITNRFEKIKSAKGRRIKGKPIKKKGRRLWPERSQVKRIIRGP